MAPKTLLHVLGQSLDDTRNGLYSTKEWDFVDSNLDKFLIYDFKSSTSFWGENRSDEWYAANPKRKYKFRKYPQVSEEEFWKSEAPHAFRVNCSKYAEWPKFKVWLEQLIESGKDTEGWEEQVDLRFGEIDLMDDFD